MVTDHRSTDPYSTDHDSTKLAEIIAAQEEIFVRRQPNSAHLAHTARQHLAGGVTSSWQITAPQPVWLSHGHGSKVYDVDGNEYVDLHGGYGAALAGHAHPAIQEAIKTQVGKGTHFAQPTPNAIAVARELARRFGLPRWRFANSGTEATMDAVHLMRSITGRDLIIKIEGCYHGHHDSVQVSVMPDPEDADPQQQPNSAPSSTGIPKAITDLTLIATFNDPDSVERLLETHKDQVAGMIIEPIMMNAGIIKPEPGYLATLKTLLHEHNALLTFDEVKTGLTVGPGGATKQQQVQPDLIFDLNTTNPNQIAAAGQSLHDLAKLTNVHIDNNDYTEVPSGQIWIHHAWSGDMATAASYMPKGVNVDVVGYWFPPDGKGPVGNDTMTVLKGAPNPVLAHLFLNYMLDVNNVLTNISYNGYMQPITGITPQRLVSEQLLPPSLMSTAVLPSYFRRGVMELQIPTATNALWEQAWLQAKS